MSDAEHRVKGAVTSVLSSGKQFAAIKALNGLYETHPKLSRRIRVFATLLGNAIQVDDPHLQETALSRIKDAKNKLRARINKVLDKADPKYYRAHKDPGVLFKDHMGSHAGTANNITNGIEEFWIEHLKQELRDKGPRR